MIFFSFKASGKSTFQVKIVNNESPTNSAHFLSLTEKMLIPGMGA